MSHGHLIWFILMWVCVGWYSTITIYVAIQGSIDIKEMLRRLKEKQDTNSSNSP